MDISKSSATYQSHGSVQKLAAETEPKAVLVGSHRVCFDDVIADTLAAPFNWESFAKAASKKYGYENGVHFVASYRELFKTANDKTKDEVLEVGKTWYATYLTAGAPRELSVPTNIRVAAMTLVQSSQDSQMGKPVLLGLVKIAWEPVYYDVLNTLFEGVFKKWAVDAAVVKDVQLSKDVALWWRAKPMNLRTFFSFPNPVDVAESRIHGKLVAILSLVSILFDIFTGIWYLSLVVFYGLFMRALCGPRLDPQAFMVLFMIRPMVVDKLHCIDHDFVAGPPRRFAQAFGALVIGLSIVLRLLGWRYASWAVAGFLAMVSMVQAILNFCLGCALFGLLMRLGLIPKKTCDTCAVKYVNTDVNCPNTLNSKKIAEIDP